MQQRFPVTEQGQVARGGSALRLGKGYCHEDAEVPSVDQLSAQQEDPVEHGNPGGLKDTFCNSANSGGTPTTDEVAYATYLLTGTQLMPYARTVARDTRSTTPPEVGGRPGALTIPTGRSIAASALRRRSTRTRMT